ncbi:MAG: hypothetical protein ACR2QH_15335 [Geminicoccaceae bacterium]
MVESYATADTQSKDEERHRRELALVINGTREGKLNCAIDVDLASAPAESTGFQHPNIASTSRMIITPADLVTASELAAGAIRIDEVDITDGSAVITHTQFVGARTVRISFLS